MGVIATRFKIRAPAKVNLFLKIVGKRADGYHFLETLICPVNWYDRLELKSGRDQIDVRCRHPLVPSGRRNLAWKAVEIFSRNLEALRGQPLEPLSVTIEKNIPVGAGLGGGSSDAAAVLRTLNKFYGRPFSKNNLQTMALTLGADVPFFLESGPCLAQGIGQRLTPVWGLEPASVVIIYPKVAVSTAEVFKNLNLGLTKKPERLKYHHFDGFGIFDFCRLGNDLEGVTLARYPQVAEARKVLLSSGADVVRMSGSGSAVFGLFGVEKAAFSAAAVLGHESRWQVFVGKLLVDRTAGY